MLALPIYDFIRKVKDASDDELCDWFFLDNGYESEIRFVWQARGTEDMSLQDAARLLKYDWARLSKDGNTVYLYDTADEMKRHIEGK